MYNILEVANCHGGSFEYITELLNEFSEFDKNFGIKFQPFHFDEIATKDYEWYRIYQELSFSIEQWNTIIQEASKTKDIWIDISGFYSAEVIAQNFEKIRGIKFQSSMLYNPFVFDSLTSIGFKNKEVILNVAGLQENEIRFFAEKIQNELKPSNLILQVGFQSYPTSIEDIGFSKIKALNNSFDNEVCLADHIDANNPAAMSIPNLAIQMGVKMFEKHVLLEEKETKYDFHAALSKNQFKEFISIQKSVENSLTSSFLASKEIDYLKKTISTPIAKNNLKKGQLVSISDLDFKRVNEDGISILDLNDLKNNKQILKGEKQPLTTFLKSDFKKAIVGVVIAGRLKSSRLPKKAILKVNEELTSIELCQKNCLSIKDVDHVVLATSTDEQDEPLKNYVFPGVKFHRGHPVDVIERYLDVIDQYGIDIIIRITADCPYPSAEAVELMLKSHFETGADYTEATGGALGSLPQIINSEALKRIKKLFGNTDYSEYMNGYLIHNPDVFKLNYIDLPEELKSNHRLTMDYENDLDLIKEVENYLYKNNLNYTYKEVIKFLDNNPKIASLNANNRIVYKADPELVEKIRIATTLK